MSSMKKILYIGNALSNKGKTKTSIETLGTFLKEICHVKIASNKANIVSRLVDMILSVLKYKSNTDFVLIDTYSTSNFYYAFIISQLCRLLKIRYIPILRGGNLERRLLRNPKYSHLLFKNAHEIIAPSNFLKTVFSSYGYDEVVFIPNTIEIDNYEFKNRSINTIELLWVRSFASIYNPEQAVLVLEQLLKMNYTTRLTMVGPDVDGTMVKVKKLAQEKNLEINFTGKLSKHQWIALSKNSNVFINTTNIDNMPVSVIEAMALGLPVVSTNVGGLPYLIDDTKDGLLVPPQDVKSMVSAILKLKSDDAFRFKLITRARSKVEKFDWNSIKHKWAALLS
jgi:glycosyltransferase involved in cell wall biosynthesis